MKGERQVFGWVLLGIGVVMAAASLILGGLSVVDLSVIDWAIGAMGVLFIAAGWEMAHGRRF